MKRSSSRTQIIGSKGETICSKWLNDNGFAILERNYTTSSGEIDVIAQKGKKIHFIEVKSIQYNSNTYVSYETLYNPAENLTSKKLRRCYTTILQYLDENQVSHETSYQFDLYMVYIDSQNLFHKIKRIENIVFE